MEGSASAEIPSKPGVRRSQSHSATSPVPATMPNSVVPAIDSMSIISEIQP